jgi:hypothetical protein
MEIVKELTQKLQELNTNAISEISKFTDKGVMASGSRARKSLGEIGKITKELRKAIQEVKNTKKTA